MYRYGFVLSGTSLLRIEQPGELCIAGPGLAEGYQNRPLETEKAFVSCPEFSKDMNIGIRMYRTGDLVSWTSQQTLMYLGRNDFQVKLRGQRIELEEIQACCEKAGSDVAAALVEQDVLWDERPAVDLG